MKRLAALAALGVLTGLAHADVIFYTTTQPLAGSENVVFNVPGLISTGTLVQGQLGVSGHVYDFIGTESLTTPVDGQARVVASDGAFTFLDIRPNTGVFSFTGMNFDINAAADSDVTLTVTEADGDVISSSFVVNGAGSNPFTIEAVSGDVITGVTISSTSSLTDVRNFRIAGSAVPEPSSMAALALGSMLFWRKRSRKA
jgi:hypothetical protein